MSATIGSSFQSLEILSFTSGSVIFNSIATLNIASSSLSIQNSLQNAINNNINGANVLGFVSFKITPVGQQSSLTSTPGVVQLHLPVIISHSLVQIFQFLYHV